ARGQRDRAGHGHAARERRLVERLEPAVADLRRGVVAAAGLQRDAAIARADADVADNQSSTDGAADAKRRVLERSGAAVADLREGHAVFAETAVVAADEGYAGAGADGDAATDIGAVGQRAGR